MSEQGASPGGGVGAAGSEPALAERHCVEYPSGSPTLAPEVVERYLALAPGWELQDEGKALRRSQRFADFAAAIEFVNRIATLAEEEQHHPDIRIYSYRWVTLDFSTHSIGGLSENDFIMAAKVNLLAPGAA